MLKLSTSEDLFSYNFADYVDSKKKYCITYKRDVECVVEEIVNIFFCKVFFLQIQNCLNYKNEYTNFVNTL